MLYSYKAAGLSGVFWAVLWALAGSGLGEALYRMLSRHLGEEATSKRGRFFLIVFSGFSLGACFLLLGWSLQFAASVVFLLCLVLCAVVDATHGIIPDMVALPGLALCLALGPWLPAGEWNQSLLGALAGGGGLYCLNLGFRLARGRDGLGMGDVKLCALLGSALGPLGVFMSIMLAAVLGLGHHSLALGRGEKKMATEVPFGPYLSVGGLLVFFWGERLADWLWAMPAI